MARRTRSRGSSVRTTTCGSIETARDARPRPGWPTASLRGGAWPRTSRATGYDLVPRSTASTTWATPLGRPATSARPLPRMGRGSIVEPFANDRVEDNLNPIGRIYYAASTLLCTPSSLSQEVGLALGRRPASGACGRSPSTAASRASDARLKRRSTWSWRPGPEREVADDHGVGRRDGGHGHAGRSGRPQARHEAGRTRVGQLRRAGLRGRLWVGQHDRARTGRSM